MITVLSGGTGGAKFLQGLAAILGEQASALTVIVNTGDDLTWWGLQVSPDLDSVMYGLGGKLSRERGWGVEGDTFACLGAARGLGLPAWFSLGDRDLATHLARTALLREGKTLAQATATLAERMEVRAKLLPMSNERVETRVITAEGELGFQEYFVRERCRPAPLGFRFAGAERAAPSPGVVGALAEANAIVIAPSNPITSVGPILAVPGIRAELRRARERGTPIAAISPIIGGAAVSGPAAALMQAAGLPVSCAGVAQAYEDFVSVMVADGRDQGATMPRGIRAHFCQTVMESELAKRELARETLRALGMPKAAEARPA